MNKRKPNALKRKKFFIRMAALVIPVIFLLLMSQTAFARNTYVITDGDRVVVHTTATSDPAAVLNEAGLLLGADDTYTTQPGLGVSEITITRKQTVNIDNCGQLLQVSSQGETVSQLLSRLSINVDANTAVSAPLEAQTADGMTITVSRTVHTTESYTQSIAHKVTHCYDSSIAEGESVVLTKGVDGQMSSTANVVYVDGQETDRTILSQTVIQQPVDEVVAIGTGPKTASPDDISGEMVIGDGYIITETGEYLVFSDVLHVEATAYTHTDAGCDYITAMGTTVKLGTVAVDPRLIPYGTRMFIVSDDGEYIYGIATAEDCGGDIKENRIDLYYPTNSECTRFGRRDCTVYILGEVELDQNYKGK